jgi:hypothetical protein
LGLVREPEEPYCATRPSSGHEHQTIHAFQNHENQVLKILPQLSCLRELILRIQKRFEIPAQPIEASEEAHIHSRVRDYHPVRNNKNVLVTYT